MVDPKSEPDYDPTEEVQSSQPAGVSGAVAAPATPDSSEESSSEAEQQEPEPKDVGVQLDSLRASMQAQATPPVVSPPFGKKLRRVVLNPFLDVDVNVSEAADLSRSAQLRPSSREHGRCAIELKILMHRPGRSIRI